MRFLLVGALVLAACRREPLEQPPPSALNRQALWQATSRMAVARTGHTATLLPNGKIFVVGGTDDANLVLRSTELYDPAANTWAPAAPMQFKRVTHTATLLPNGEVLITGGITGSAASPSAELYNPATNVWQGVPSMIVARAGHTATLLNDGKVLVGGSGLAELFDPALNGWSLAGTSAARTNPTATLLPNGKVLLAGGVILATTTVTSELYDPTTNTWSAAAPMGAARARHEAVLLQNGKVLVAGGRDSASLGSAELYDPATNTWLGPPLMAIGRHAFTATALLDGRVLVTGGVGPLASSELYDPALNSWSGVRPMTFGRNGHTATRLPTGEVLIAGGVGSGTVPWAELYLPTTGGTACTSGAACPSGFCVDGLCCDTACAGACDACDLPGSPGVCTVNPTGSPGCTGFACSGASAACPTSCTLDSECLVGFHCSAGSCSPKINRGGPCSAPNQCVTGLCTDSRCCNSDCVGACNSCDFTGTCVNNPTGSPGAPSCAPTLCAGGSGCPIGCATDLQCVTTHTCDAGACVSRKPNGASCASNLECSSRFCRDGLCCSSACSGQCDTCDAPGSVGTCILHDAGFVGSPSCSPYKCSGASATCPFKCTTSDDCAVGFRCSTSGFCSPRLALGNLCTSGSDCMSGNCADGACCNTPCDGSCDTCARDGGRGTCSIQPDRFEGLPSCSPYFCMGAAACQTGCVADSDCVATHFCKANACTPKLPQGSACTTDSHCSAELCADGFCCDRRCSGSCESCNVAGAEGKCTYAAVDTEGSPSCAPYVCGATGKCRGTCTVDANCVSPNFCSGGFCTTTPVVPYTPPVGSCGCQASEASALPFLGLLLLALWRPRARIVSESR